MSVNRRNTWPLVGACMVGLLSGCAATRAHLRTDEITAASRRAPAPGDILDSTLPRPGYTYARAVREAFRHKREVIEDSQIAMLASLIPLTGFVGYQAARGNNPVQLGALSTAGLTGLSLHQALIQVGRVRVYQEADKSLTCGINLYEASVLNDPRASTVGEARRRLLGLESQMNADVIRARMISEQAPQFFAPTGAGYRALQVAGHVPTVADINTGVTALQSQAGGVIEDIQGQAATLGSWDAAIRGVGSSAWLDGQLRIFTNTVLTKASSDLDNSMPNLAESMGLFNGLQLARTPPANKPVPVAPTPVAAQGRSAVLLLPPGTPIPAGLDEAIRAAGLPSAADYGVNMAVVKAMVDEIVSQPAQTPATLSFADCLYSPVTLAYNGPVLPFLLGPGDGDQNSVKSLPKNGSLTILAMNGVRPHFMVASSAQADSLTIAQSDAGKHTMFTIAPSAKATVGQDIEIQVVDSGGGAKKFHVEITTATP